MDLKLLMESLYCFAVAIDVGLEKFSNVVMYKLCATRTPLQLTNAKRPIWGVFFASISVARVSDRPLSGSQRAAPG